MSKPPSPRQRAKAALRDLIREAGNPGRLGLALGFTRVPPYSWDVLPDYALADACREFKKKPEELRPDLSPYQIRKAMAGEIPKPGRPFARKG